ncbi:Sre G protein-coupled chemoreceptor [Ancylostoma ceylanicum]|uniref:Sre G protein-coupled chemoreceptor n=1 Tax=Ancylostoma ceylanicum TaxID=53326 RepID=A0A0D6LUE9_9BILA|nr:Sre G protein-coupled chemoreceptor [Ancylostoma ceylanicum]
MFLQRHKHVNPEKRNNEYGGERINKRKDDLVSKLPLLIASLLRMWFFIAAAGFLKAVLVERACASYFIVDYENKARQWISTTIIVFSLFATFVFTISFMFSESLPAINEELQFVNLIAVLYPVVAGLAGGSFSALAALAVSAILYRRNRSQLLNLDKGITAASIEYTLSIKFQLMENIRVMRIVVATFCLMAGVIVFALSLLALAFIQFDEFPDKAQLCFAFYDLIVALTITFLTLAFAVHMGEWRRVYLHFPPTIRQFCLRKFAALEGKRVTHIREHENAGQQYFDQLKKAWGN